MCLCVYTHALELYASKRSRYIYTTNKQQKKAQGTQKNRRQPVTESCIQVLMLQFLNCMTLDTLAVIISSVKYNADNTHVGDKN